MKPSQWRSSYLFIQSCWSTLPAVENVGVRIFFCIFKLYGCILLNFFVALKMSTLRRKIVNSFIVFGISETIVPSIQIRESDKVQSRITNIGFDNSSFKNRCLTKPNQVYCRRRWFNN